MSERSPSPEEKPKLPQSVEYDHTPSDELIERAFADKAHGDELRARGTSPERITHATEHHEDITVLGGLKAVLSVEKAKGSERRQRRQQNKERKKAVKRGVKLDKNMRRAVTNVDRREVFGTAGEEFDVSDIPTTHMRRGYTFNEFMIQRTADRMEAKGEKRRDKIAKKMGTQPPAQPTQPNPTEQSNQETRSQTQEDVNQDPPSADQLRWARRISQETLDRLSDDYLEPYYTDTAQPEVVQGEVIAEQTTPRPEEEIYDIEFVEDTPEASEPQKYTEPKSQESDPENTEFKSNTGIDVAILQSLSKEISHSVSDTVRATKLERNLGKDDKLPREDFESILNNAIEVNIKDWLIKTGLASKDESAKLHSMFEHIKADLDNFRKFSDRQQAKQEKKSLKQREQEAAQAVADNATQTAIES